VVSVSVPVLMVPMPVGMQGRAVEAFQLLREARDELLTQLRDRRGGGGGHAQQQQQGVAAAGCS